MIFAAVLVCSIFIRLGLWQVQRAYEKSQILLQHQAAQQRTPAILENKKMPKQYQRVEVQGRYLPTIFLLDNQHYNHQPGVQVYAPLLLSNGSVLIIDRGWIQNRNPRQTIPNLEIPPGIVKIMGSTYYPSTKQWVLGAEIEQIGKELFIIERYNAQLLSQLLQKSVYPFIIRLDKSQAHGFIRDWKIIAMPPERHKANALQWFSMAFIVLIIFIALNLKRENEKIIP